MTLIPLLYIYLVVGFLIIVFFIWGQIALMVFVYRKITGHSLEKRTKALLWVMFVAVVYYIVCGILVFVCVAYIPILSSDFWFNMFFICLACGFFLFLVIDPINFKPTEEEEMYVYIRTLPEVRSFVNKFRSPEKVKDLENRRIALQLEVDAGNAVNGIVVKSAVEKLAEDLEGFDDAPKTDKEFFKSILGLVIGVGLVLLLVWIFGC